AWARWCSPRCTRRWRPAGGASSSSAGSTSCTCPATGGGWPRAARPGRAGVPDGVAAYDPLVAVGGLPCFPARPRQEQLAGPVAGDLESHWGRRDGEELMTLVAGADFDAALLATSLR